MLSTTITIIVATLHLYFLYFEMFDWTKTGPKIFRGYDKEFFQKSKTLAANQGLYNGFLVAGLIWSFIISDPVWQENVRLFFLACVAVAGLYGGLTASKKIFFVQALPALLGILMIVVGW